MVMCLIASIPNTARRNVPQPLPELGVSVRLLALPGNHPLIGKTEELSQKHLRETVTKKRTISKEKDRARRRRFLSLSASLLVSVVLLSASLLSSAEHAARSASQVRVRSQVTGVSSQGGASTGEHSFNVSHTAAGMHVPLTLCTNEPYRGGAQGDCPRASGVTSKTGPLVTHPHATADHRLYTLPLTL